ncbi:hypothetical protein OQA88_8474 [Cercophora sp. LCS_1]
MADVDPEKDAGMCPDAGPGAGDALSSTCTHTCTHRSVTASKAPSLYSQAPSQSSDDSDPLSPLEHALTPDLRLPDEQVLSLSVAQTRTSVGSSASRLPDFEVAFDADDPDSPRNWPLWYRSWVIVCVSYSAWVVVLFSTSYTATITGVMEEFNITSVPVATLGLSTYLLGLAVGSVIVAPMSELPVTGPLIGGFVFQYLGWRWANWLAIILSGVALLMLFTVKETYAPTILKRKAAQKRKETDDERWWCRYDVRISTMQLLKINLSRPFVLAVTEPILWCFNIWISVIYGILYLCFVAYPIVFVQHRGWGPGISGLAFLGIGVGTLFAVFLEPVWRRIINSSARRDPETGRAAPEATAAVMCIGAILTPIGQLAFSWTCLPVTIHWAVPISFGVLFGWGNTLCFIYGGNYLASAYGIYSASALAGNAVMRSLFGAALPLAGPAMYSALTPQWAGTLLGLLEVLLIPIPFAFYRWGDRIRAKSRLIKLMREETLKNEGRRKKREARLARRGEIVKGKAPELTQVVSRPVGVMA